MKKNALYVGNQSTSLKDSESLDMAGNVEKPSENTIESGERNMGTTQKLPKLTRKQKIFADALLETGKKAESALKAYDTDSIKVASVIAAENLEKPSIQQYLADKSNDAVSMIYSLSQTSEQDVVRLNASKDILDRAGYKAPEKHLNISLEVSKEERDKILGVAFEVINKMTNEEVTG